MAGQAQAMWLGEGTQGSNRVFHAVLFSHPPELPPSGFLVPPSSKHSGGLCRANGLGPSWLSRVDILGSSESWQIQAVHISEAHAIVVAINTRAQCKP